MKLLRLLLYCVFLAPLCADTVYTVPQGYTKLTIPAAVDESTPSLSVISATLLADVEYSGQITVENNYDADPDSDPLTNQGAQTITATGTAWAANQWTTEAHLAYLVNGSASEEAFLITSHTTTTLTIDAPFDLLNNSRFPASTTVKIRKANTVGSILGTTETPFTTSDRVYLWTGEAWQTLVAAGGNWIFVGGDSNGQPANNAVVFPEEGIFVQRGETTGAVLTLFGEVPAISQASTVPGVSSQFVSTRFPVGDSPGGIRLDALNIEQIPGWSVNDRAYFWTGTEWQTLVFAGGNWIFVGGDESGQPANGLLVPPSSALFLTRASTGTGSESPLNVPLPYPVD